MDLFGLTTSQIIAMFIVGYLILNAIIFGLSGACRGLSWLWRRLIIRFTSRAGK